MQINLNQFIFNSLRSISNELSLIKQLMLSQTPSQAVFNAIYESDYWGGSGVGSNAKVCASYIKFIEDFIDENSVKSVVDCGCGDWQFSRYINWGEAQYSGFDVAKMVVDKNKEQFSSDKISFNLYDGDFAKLPNADLILCKDVLQHLPNAAINAFIENLSKYKFALITNDLNPNDKRLNSNINPGDYRSLDLSIAPFNIACKEVLRIRRWPQMADIVAMLWINPDRA